MGVLEDLNKMLDRIPVWKRLGEVPAEVDDLKKRVAELEGKLNGKWPADVCRFSGERAARLKETLGPDGQRIVTEIFACEKCGQWDHRARKL